jgi:hypothetical protein
MKEHGCATLVDKSKIRAMGKKFVRDIEGEKKG